MNVKRKNKLHIITGGPGFGKTSIIKELSKSGYKTGEEIARDIIHNQLKVDGGILPWKNVKAFQQEVFGRRLSFYDSIGEEELAFSDRGIPDQLAFARFRGFSPEILKESADKYRYASTVFIASPWKEIYVIDDIRKETFEEACRMHEMVCKVYNELGYKLVELPKANVKERVVFVLNYFP